MADYISRGKAIEAIMDLPNCPNGYSDTYDKECIIGTLEEVPTANVRENVHAKWIVEEVYSNWSDWTNVRCPVCRRVFEKFYRSNFCPNCGADMRGEQDGEIH